LETYVLIKSQKDFFSGLMFTIVGVAFAIGATEYTVGQAARMGPGYFPMMLGILLSVLGVAVAAKSFSSTAPDGDKIGKWAWRPLALVIAANLVFGAQLGGLPSVGFPSFGLIAAIYALVVISSFAGGKPKLVETIVLSTVLAIGSYLAFIKLLNLQFQVWPAFIGG
jgi:hypothetical protein